MAQPERKELDPWLAGMNALALSFILTALGVFLPHADAARSPTFPLKVEEPAKDNSLAMDLSPPPPSAEASSPETAEQTPSAEPASEPEAMDLPPPVQLPAYRELPEMIDPVPVQDPPRLPTPTPAEDRRPEPVPAPRPAAKPTTPATRPGPAPASIPGSVPRGGAAGPSGGTPGGTGPGPRAGNGSGRGTTPQPPYPAFARRDRLQGTVVVSIAVVDGSVTGVRLITSSGHASLDQYAISHVQRRWKWSAGTTRTFTQPFRFVLK